MKEVEKLGPLELFARQLKEEKLLEKNRRTWAGRRVLMAISRNSDAWKDSVNVAIRAECGLATARKHLKRFLEVGLVEAFYPPSHLDSQRIVYRMKVKVRVYD